MEHLSKYIIGGVVSFIFALVLRYLEAKSKLVYWAPHFALFRVPLPKGDGQENEVENFPIQTNSVYIQNLGRKTAENVEIIFKTKPDHFMLTPEMLYDTVTQENGTFVVKLESLGAKEYFILQLLSYATLPSIDSIRSKDGQAKCVPFHMLQANPKWVQILGIFFLLTGVGTTLYWLAKTFNFLAHKLGLV